VPVSYKPYGPLSERACALFYAQYRFDRLIETIADLILDLLRSIGDGDPSSELQQFQAFRKTKWFHPRLINESKGLDMREGSGKIVSIGGWDAAGKMH
jgi:hypothetical protein